MEAASAERQRVASIDILRGLAMVLMALDHTRDYFHFGSLSLGINPLDPAVTTPWIYITRWITHLCAPAFVFLTGMSAYLYTQKLGVKPFQAAWFCFSRGLWLVFLEMTVVVFAWTFNPDFTLFFMQVIWAIGASLVLLTFFFYLPRKLLLAVSLLIIICHNFFDGLEFEQGTTEQALLAMLHQVDTVFILGREFRFVYPMLPWFGILLLGYSLGFLFKEYNHKLRARTFLWGGLSALLLFFALRFLGSYGDPFPFESGKTALASVYLFFDVNKYPPSLLYTLLFVGLSLWLLLLFEWVRLPGLRILKVYGSVPLFYYVLHLYLLHGLSLVVFLATGGNLLKLDWEKGIWGYPFGFGYGLVIVYGVWLGVVVLLYPLCAWFAGVKARNKSAWWVSYV